MNSYPPPYPPSYPPQVPYPSPKNGGTFKTLKIFFIIFIPLLWIVAGVLPAYSRNYYDGNPWFSNDSIIGFACLWWGWMMVGVNAFAFIAWLANIPFWVAYFLFACSSKKQPLLAAVIVSGVALFFSLGALTVEHIDKAALYSSRYSPSIGAYLWIFSIALALVASILRYNVAKKEEPMPPPFIPPYYPPQPPQNFPRGF